MLTSLCCHLSTTTCSNYIKSLSFKVIYIFLFSRPFSSPGIRVISVAQGLCQVAYTDIYFNRITQKTEIQLQKTTNMSSKRNILPYLKKIQSLVNRICHDACETKQTQALFSNKPSSAFLTVKYTMSVQ